MIWGAEGYAVDYYSQNRKMADIIQRQPDVLNWSDALPDHQAAALTVRRQVDCIAGRQDRRNIEDQVVKFILQLA